MGGVFVFWKLPCRRVPRLVVESSQRFPEVGRSLRDNISAERRDERGFDLSAVFVDDVRVAENVIHAHHSGRAAECCKTRREEKERNSAIKIKSTDFRKNRKRRIIKHYTIIRITEILEISAGVKWSDDLRRINAVFRASPVANRRIDFWRCIAIIRRQLGLEFFDKFFIRFAVSHKNNSTFP